MQNKPLQQITFDDVQGLKTNSIPESRTLEYKSALPGNDDRSRIRFLGEVCALANTSGGIIVYGVSENKGLPIEISGVSIDDPDAVLLRLEQIIRAGLEPVLASFDMKLLTSEAGISVLVLHISKSWNGPHRVSFKDHSRFYARNTAGKYPMDISELRAAFLQSDSLVASMRQFRRERAEKIKNRVDLPAQLESGGALILHLIPFDSMTGSASSRLDVGEIKSNAQSVSPLGASGWDSRLNMDGIVKHTGDGNGKSRAYTQIFRSGIVEATAEFTEYDGDPYIPSESYEEESIEAVEKILGFMKGSGISLPLALFVSLVDVRHHRFAAQRSFRLRQNNTLDRDDLLIPEVVCESYERDAATILKPAFDMVWQSFGFESSFNYDENGQWVGQR